VAQGIWSTALTFSGSYEQLYTYVVFAVVLFHAATGAGVFILRRQRPDAPRPYKVWGYPWIPWIFIVSSLVLVANTLVEKPVESLIGVFILVAGILLLRRQTGFARVCRAAGSSDSAVTRQ
jgi:APA family basic amino acid/polyamine antiporter